MRVSSSSNQEAWLFTLAEEKLSVFANRIDQELPDMSVLERSNAVASDFSVTGNSKKVASTSTDTTLLKTITLLGEYSLSKQLKNSQQKNKNLPESAYLEGFGGFREKLIEVFASI